MADLDPTIAARRWFAAALARRRRDPRGDRRLQRVGRSFPAVRSRPRLSTALLHVVPPLHRAGPREARFLRHAAVGLVDRREHEEQCDRPRVRGHRAQRRDARADRERAGADRVDRARRETARARDPDPRLQRVLGDARSAQPARRPPAGVFLRPQPRERPAVPPVVGRARALLADRDRRYAASASAPTRMRHGGGPTRSASRGTRW